MKMSSSASSVSESYPKISTLAVSSSSSSDSDASSSLSTTRHRVVVRICRSVLRETPAALCLAMLNVAKSLYLYIYIFFRRREGGGPNTLPALVYIHFLLRRSLYESSQGAISPQPPHTSGRRRTAGPHRGEGFHAHLPCVSSWIPTPRSWLMIAEDTEPPQSVDVSKNQRHF
jgi:hypothetical protein